MSCGGDASGFTIFPLHSSCSTIEQMFHMKQVLYLDGDAFAVAVERARNPKLCNRPVVVGNDAGGRGLVYCASYEARALGVWTGMPLSRARRRLPGGVFLPESRADYELASRRVFEMLRSTAPVVEAASVDDFYMDVTGCERLFGGNLWRWAVELQRRIAGEVGVGFSVGLAPNKMLARIAGTLAKPSHLVEVLPGAEQNFIAQVKVGLLPGVGEATCERLRECGITVAGQLAALGEDAMCVLFGQGGSELWRRARGEFNEPVKPTALHRRIVHQYQFPQDTAKVEALEAAAALLAQKLAFDLRRHEVRCGSAELWLYYGDGAACSRRVEISYPSDQDFALVLPVQAAVRAAFQRRVRVRRLRLRASFIPLNDGQFDLFEEKQQHRRKRLYDAIDAVRERHGFKSLLSARTLGVRTVQG